MSSNEELAVMIQQGQTRLYSELWGQTERFFKGCAYKYINKHGERLAASGIELDDLMQVSFLALYDAVQAFEPSTGYKLLTYTKYPLQSHFAELYGTRSAKRLPLNHCKSLDEPLTEETETTLGEQIPDEAATQNFENAEQRIYNEQLHNALDAALESIKEQTRTVIRRRYYDNKPLRSIANDIGISISQAQKIERKALKELRRGKPAKLLSPYRDEILTQQAYFGTGLTAFKNNGASSAERALEEAERLINEIINR